VRPRASRLHRLIDAGSSAIRRPGPLARARFRARPRPAAHARRRLQRAQAEIAVEWLAQAGEQAEWVDVERQRHIEPGAPSPAMRPARSTCPMPASATPATWTQLLRGNAQAAASVHVPARGRLKLPLGAAAEAALRAGAPRSGSRSRGGRARRRPAARAEFDAIVICAALRFHPAACAARRAPALAPDPRLLGDGAATLRDAAPHVAARRAARRPQRRIAITRLGSRVRVAGGHELGVPWPIGARGAVREYPSGRYTDASTRTSRARALDAGACW
jgi:hypothetical protein